MTCDFHLHTTCSDGIHPPREMRDAVRRARVRHWAITDHDTLAGWRALAGEAGLLPGVEITAQHGAREIHIVGLGVDPDHAGLTDFLAGIRALRRARLQRTVAALGLSARLPIDQLAPAAETVTRSHLAGWLVRLGVAATINAAFADHIGDAQQAALALPAFPDPATTCAAIRAAGGVAILAHPGCYGDRASVEAVLATAAFDGLEGRHPRLSPAFAAALVEVAEIRGLLLSCGSDLHALHATRRPGDEQLAESRLRPLLDRLGLAA